MKICFISGDINRAGGTERVCSLIANGLAEKHDVTILSLKNGLNPFFECNKKIKIESLNLEKDTGFFKRKLCPYLKLKKFLKNNPQDVIINVDVISTLYTLPMKLFFKTKVIAWEHFNYRINNGTKNRDYARKLCAKYADYIVVLTDADKNEYKNNLKMKAPIKRIYNPIVGKIHHNDLKQNIVLTVGRFSYQKNFEELVCIWEKVEKNNPQWKLVICGGGSEFDNIKKMASEKKLKNIEFPGVCKDIDKYYKNASIFVMTSRFEGFPMVLLEAQQNSIPLIAYDCFTGPSEIIDNDKNGYLIDYGDREEFIKKLEIMMNNKEILTRFSKYSYDSVKKYDIKEIINEWEKVLEEISN